MTRVFLALLILVSTIYSSITGWRWHQELQQIASTSRPWFAPYVDITARPRYAFEQLGSTHTPNVILAFIVASKSDACTPAWGSVYTLEQASNVLDLDRRILRFEQQGGKIGISFGGAINSELALHCTDADQLFKSYQMVVERYRIDVIDLDLENEGLNDTQAVMRRAIAIAKLQSEYQKKGKKLAVWLTLPVAPSGMTQAGTDAVLTMLTKGVELTGVNLMTMDYNKHDSQSVIQLSKQALLESHRQLGVLYKRSGATLGSTSLWRKIGVTPMLGQNDIATEIFTSQDAKDLNAFAKEHGVGRVSMWSANRDIPCGENYVDVKVVSDSCSGVKTDKFGFAKILSLGFDGNLAPSDAKLTSEDLDAKKQIIDDPKTSPYQIWQETGAYLQGTKVVWHGNVYQAKWWTKGNLPDDPVLQAWETPWQLLGPVLPNEKPILQPALPKGVYPEWSGTVQYKTGQRVIFEGLPFQAKWWNQGQSPAAATANADSSPWVPLTQDQITDILKTQTYAAKNISQKTKSR